MKAVVYDAPRSFSITKIPEPTPGPGEVLIKVIQTGICGTDLHIHEGDFYAAFPLIPGHEIVGTRRRRRQRHQLPGGERVTVNPNISCGHCHACRSGRPMLCRTSKASAPTGLAASPSTSPHQPPRPSPSTGSTTTSR